MVRQADSVHTDDKKINTELNDDKGEDFKSFRHELSDFKKELVFLTRDIKGMSGSKFFSTVDLKSGYYQIPVAKEDRPKTAFSFPGKFILKYADKAKSLYKVTEKNQKFVWTDDCQQSFEKLKNTLISAPILAYPTREDLFILDIDASNVGMGAVLSQLQDGIEKVICYFSKTFSRSERRYCVTRRELLAVMASIKHFHHYLYGKYFKVRSDHGALSWLFNFKNPESQLAR
ncbi:unnamed protein product [Mytilus coruscus]|uniref:Uncharacterized protein n=1 Tax=Mytilus coruscus TaxID=42192 RepID=A0A6J8EH20_MYTCO|nr:unnamed protein product [Mytilus coruscus]